MIHEPASVIPQRLSEAGEIIRLSVAAAHPDVLLRSALRLHGSVLEMSADRIDLDRFERILVVGAGKASATMAAALESMIGGRITEGLVVTKYGHRCPTDIIQVVEAGHPVPDEKGVKASEAILRLCRSANDRDLVICLISGGGSALLEVLPPEITLRDLQLTTNHLLASGAPIEEVNAIRRRLSLVKNGGLLAAIAPANCLGLIISDVIDSPLEDIASGPTCPPTAASDLSLMDSRRVRVLRALPASVQQRLRGPRTVGGAPADQWVRNIIIGSNTDLLDAARSAAEHLGYEVTLVSDRLRGEASDVGRWWAGLVTTAHSHRISGSKPLCLLAGGETTVTIRGKGKGGRNQELALAAMTVLRDQIPNYVVLSVGTDGTDGPTSAAGGIVTPLTWEKVMEGGWSPELALRENDSHGFLSKVDALINTGPTGTNVMDMVMALV